MAGGADGVYGTRCNEGVGARSVAWAVAGGVGFFGVLGGHGRVQLRERRRGNAGEHGRRPFVIS